MSFFTFLNPDPNFKVPDMDTNIAVRRILQLLNDNTPPSGGASGSGSTTSVGATFKTLSDVIVDTVGSAKQCAGQVSPRGVMVCADLNNTGTIYVGDSTVTNGSGSKRGFALTQAGQLSVVLPVNNTNQIYVNADNNGDRATITVL